MALARPAVLLPGVRFEPQPPATPDILPRMDIAGFVGMAARGPLDVPVPVEDLAGFTAVFGGDLVLGIDPDDGGDVTAQLRPSVAAFLRNGGRRCWVVRVAGQGASALTFRIPGVLVSTAAPASGGARRSAAARVCAASAGRWSAGLSVGASLDAQRLEVRGVERAPQGGPDAGSVVGIRVAGDAASVPGDLTVVPGDLIRVRAADGITAFVPVTGVRSSSGNARTIDLGPGDAFAAGPPAEGLTGRATCTDATGQDLRADAEVSTAESAEPGDATLRIALPAAARPPDGSWIRLDTGTGTWWILAAAVRAEIDASGQHVRITGPAFRHVGGAADILRTWADAAAVPVADATGGETGAVAFAASRTGVDRLRLALASGATTLSNVQADLGLAPGHPRFIGDLPTDERRFGPDPRRPWEAPADRVPVATATGDLAGLGVPGLFIPLAVGNAPVWLSAADDPGGDPDDLDTVEPGRFLDEDLAGVSAASLIAESGFIRYQRPQPRSLRGVHALLDADEVTLVAVPDLAGRPWVLAPARRPLAAGEPVVQSPPRPTFDACDPGAPATPRPRLEWLGDDRRGFRIAWHAVAHAASYEIEETREPASWTPPTIVEQRRVRLTVSTPEDGVWRFRVRARNRHGRSPWSPVVRVVVGTGTARMPGQGPEPAALVAAHAAVLRMCAARGDLFAILSLPRGTTPAASLAHLDAVRETLVPTEGAGARWAAPDADELGLLSFGAVYHPWIVTVADPAAEGIARDRDALPLGGPIDHVAPPGRHPTATGEPRALPPDGAVMGVHAARARERGAWVAAANAPLLDVVAIDGPVGDDDLLRLHAGGVNVVRRTPAGFLVLASHTLSQDRVLRKANVRRLLALLRRIALLYGPDYVFEPNGGALRRRIQRGFETLLALLFSRGAFAGDRAADAYRVEVGDPPNAPTGVDAGRLVIDLKVAPAVPLEFMTVRMVRTGDRLAVEGP